MHEHGLVDRLVRTALAEAEQRGARLRGVRVRLGAMATIRPEALRHDFDHIVRDHLGLDVTLDVEEAPDHPAGVEITGLELAR